MEKKIRWRSLQDAERKLKEFEAKYGMPSDSFYSQFNMGQLPESEDFFLWAALYDLIASREQAGVIERHVGQHFVDLSYWQENH